MTPHTKATGCVGWYSVPWTPDQCYVCVRLQTKETRRGSGPIRPVCRPVTTQPRRATIQRTDCIHLGPIIETASCRNHVYHCLFDGHDHERCTKRPSKIHSCQNCKAYQTPPLTDGLTVAITYWQRPEQLKRLRESIERYLPGIPVLVEDTQGNLSAGRNRLYAKVETKYLLMMEEDFVIRSDTPPRLLDAVSILDFDPGIAGVGGTCQEKPQRKVWGHNFTRVGDKVGRKASERPLRTAPNGVRYRPCDLILNWGVFRTDLFRHIQWDEDLPITEHLDFYWRASQAGYEFAFYSPLFIDHLRERPNGTYKQGRNRNFSGRIKTKHGFQFVNHV